MIYALITYWIVAGVAFWAIPTKYPAANNFVVFLICMAIGGIGIPARLLLKVVS